MKTLTPDIWLFDAKTGMTWWTMEDPVEETTLINMADVSLVYGPQIVSPSS